MRFLTPLIVFAWSLSNGSGDWSQFLGPARNGITQSVVVPLSFPGGEPKLEWEYELGNGFSGPVVSDDQVFIFHRKGNRSVIDSLSLDSGNLLWSFGYGTDYIDDFGFDKGPRAVPLVNSGRVYIFGAEGMTHCVKSESGKLIWLKDLRKELGSTKGFFGRACSPLLIGKTLIIQTGGKDCGVVGLDAERGTLKWKSTNHEAGYSSPIATKINGKEIAVLFTRTGFLCIDPDTGKVIIEKAHQSAMNSSVNAASPVMVGSGKVFLSACYGVGAAVWEIDPENKKLSTVWEAGDRLDCHYATPVLFQGHLIGFHGRQETGTELRCIDASTGKVKWSSGRISAGSVTLAKKTLLVLTERGELILAPASTKSFKPSARGQILGADTRAMPALAKGRIFARDKRKLVSIKLNP